MSYNGIGLSTARGSGTNGHIQRNLSTIRPQTYSRSDRNAADDKRYVARPPDAAILEHERKRKIEVQCLELRDSLENQGLIEEKIESKVEELRARLLKQSAVDKLDLDRKAALHTHELGLAKIKRDEKLKQAFKIRSDHVEGEAFDPEAQERRRQQRQEERSARQAERDEKGTNRPDYGRRNNNNNRDGRIERNYVDRDRPEGRNRSPPRRRVRSPSRRRSPVRRSPSPRRNRFSSRSPKRDRSLSPSRSPSPRRERSRSRSPMRNRSLSPRRTRSLSPSRRSISPRRQGSSPRGGKITVSPGRRDRSRTPPKRQGSRDRSASPRRFRKRSDSMSTSSS